MLIVKIDKLKKHYQDRIVLDVRDLKIYEGEKVGLVGINGSGKTTLLNILCGRTDCDEGSVYLDKSFCYICQADEEVEIKPDRIAKEMALPSEYKSYLSGGEKVKARIAKALGENVKIIIADEPTSNLDVNSIKYIEDQFKQFQGSVILVSHDRNFLDSICTKIIELDKGSINVYKGNYSSYIEQKNERLKREEFEYEEYINEKNRLETAVIKKTYLRDGIKRTPKRFGNSEARLYKMGDQAAKKSMDNAIKSIKTRIAMLKVKEKPKADQIMKVDIIEGKGFYSNYPIAINNLSIAFEDKSIIENACFKLKKNKKAALIGDNGSGKTVLIKHIMNANDCVKVADRVKIGYFQQDLRLLNEDKSIIENIKEESSFDETFIRIVLSRFLFKGDSIYKKVGVLSGGEKVRASICKVILSDNNLLILDEPTNYLDILSMEALEEALKNSNKTMLIVSHDRKFISNICDEVLIIDNKKLIHYPYPYDEWHKRIDKQNKVEVKNNKNERIMIVQNRLAETISLISIETDSEKRRILENNYNNLLLELKQLN